MNILFVSDYDYMSPTDADKRLEGAVQYEGCPYEFGIKAIGGSQTSNRYIIEEGRSRGHKIVTHNHAGSIVDFVMPYDAIITSNLEIIYAFRKEKIQYIKAHPNHIRVERDSAHYFSDEDRKSLFESAKKTFFLTEYHFNFFKELYGDYFVNPQIVPSYIDTSIFKDEGLEKTFDVVYCGYLHRWKGKNDIIKFAKENPNRKVDIFGWADYNVAPEFDGIPNLKFHGQRDKFQIAEILKKTHAIFHCPHVREPLCRMVAEALLCGVRNFIGNPDRIGAWHDFNKFGSKEFANRFDNAANLFWDKIEE